MKLISSIILCFFFSSGNFAAEIRLWHAFEGFIEEKFEEIIDGFNQDSSHTILLEKEGNYSQIVQKAIHTFPESHPHILQVYEVATKTMLAHPEMFLSLESLFKKCGKFPLLQEEYIDAVRSFYSSSDGTMVSFPWNVSVGILYYNKDLFKQAGLNPNQPPLTYEDLEKCTDKLLPLRVNTYTTAWPAAYHLECILAQNNLPFSTLQNGFIEGSSKLCFDHDPLIYHIQKLQQWRKDGTFLYSGRVSSDADTNFTSGKCAILLQGANRLPLIQRQCDFELGVGYIPYWEKHHKNKCNLPIGGASFFALSGFSDEEYEAIAELFTFLSREDIVTKWHTQTGYLPITKNAYQKCIKSGFYEKNRASFLATNQVMYPSKLYTKGIRISGYMEIRELIIDEIEKVLFKNKDPKNAILDAIENGNQSCLCQAKEKL